MTNLEQPSAPDAASLNTVPMNTPLGRRISVIGAGGKSTLARAISTKLDLPHIELDALYWKPNWGESTADEMKQKIATAVEAAPDGWVMCGQYWGILGDTALKQTDMVVLIDLPWRVGLWRMLKRSIRRAIDKNKICGDNTESWRKMFTRDALWVYWITHRRAIIQRPERLASLLPESIPVVHLKTPQEQNRFYEVHGLSMPS